MDLEDIMLSEIGQTQKNKYRMTSHMESKKKKKQQPNLQIYRTETDWWLPEVRV